jgi:hypothetical protein
MRTTQFAVIAGGAVERAPNEFDNHPLRVA